MHYEGLLLVPRIARGPGVPAGTTLGSPVFTLDLAATQYDYAAATDSCRQHGASLRSVIEQGAVCSHSLNEWELLPGRAGVALSLRTVRTATDKLTMNLRSGAGEMYDLSSDPLENKNIFDGRESAEIRRELEKLILSRPDDMLLVAEPVGMA